MQGCIGAKVTLTSASREWELTGRFEQEEACSDFHIKEIALS